MNGRGYPWIAGWVAPLIVVAVTLVVCWPVVDNAFVNWGDERELVQNAGWKGFSPAHLGWMFTRIHMGHYQPLTWLTFALDYRLHGLDPRAFHATGLLLHAACALVAYWLILDLLELAGAVRRGTGYWAARIAAAAGSLTFSLHPLRVESIAWASERRGPLSALCFLLAIRFWLAYARSGGGQRKHYVAALLLFLASLLAKELALTLPAVLLVLDVDPLRRLPPGRRWSVTTWRPLLLEKSPFFGLALVWAVISARSSTQSAVAHSLAEFSIPQRLAQTFYGLAFYPWKTLVPIDLSNLYPLPRRLDPLEARFIVSAIAVLAITAALAALARRLPSGLAVWVAYCVMVLPVSGLVQTGHQITADRYSYLPAVGLGAVTAGALLAGWRRGGAPMRIALILLTLLTLGSLSRATRGQIAVWRDSETLWARAIAVDPTSAIAHNNYGVVLDRAGRLELATEHLSRATELDPEYVEALLNHGSALAKAGRFADAASRFEAALAVDPSNRKARANLERARKLAASSP